MKPPESTDKLIAELSDARKEIERLNALIEIERENVDRVFNSTPSAAAIWRGEELVFERVNAAYQSLFPDLKLEGVRFEEALPPRVTRDYPKLFSEVLKTGKPFSIQEQYTPIQQSKDGPFEDHYYNVNFVQLRNRDGSPYGVYQHTVDVTEQVRARKLEELAAKRAINERKKLETIIFEAPAAIALMRGPDLHFELANDKWTNLVSSREFLEKPYASIYPELVNSPAHLSLLKTFETGESFTAVEMKLEIASVNGVKENQYFDFTNIRVLDSDGNPYGVFCHAINVTDRVTARDHLEESRRISEQKVIGRDELLSICGHELRTPVTTMKLATQMFKRGLDKNGTNAISTESVVKMVEQSDRQLDRLIRLIDEMLDFSRIQSGKLKLNFELFNLRELVQDVLDRMNSYFETNGTSITLVPGEPVFGEWDRFRLDQILTNLLTNAHKYGEMKPVQVKLEESSGRAILTVSDLGSGISEVDQKRIFEPYERAVSYNHISGLGLGLYIVRQIVESHGGTIEVKSALKSGSAFCVTLPKENSSG